MKREGDSTIIVNELLAELRLGRDSARGELLAYANRRFQKLANQMLDDRLERWTTSKDLLQEALVRLYQAMETVRPENALHYRRLVALHLRRTSIDFFRHFYGPNRPARHHLTEGAVQSSKPNGMNKRDPDDAGESDPAIAAEKAEDLASFHQQVDELPEDLRDVIDHKYYHGLKIAEISEALGVSSATVRARLAKAKRVLRRRLGTDRLPGE